MWKPKPLGLGLMLAGAALPLAAAQYLVTTPGEVDRVSQRLAPGDSIILQSGIWSMPSSTFVASAHRKSQ